jgi:hypothetical protein
MGVGVRGETLRALGRAEAVLDAVVHMNTGLLAVGDHHAADRVDLVGQRGMLRGAGGEHRDRRGQVAELLLPEGLEADLGELAGGVPSPLR